MFNLIFVLSFVIGLILSLTTQQPFLPWYVYTQVNAPVVNAAVSASTFCAYDGSNYIAITWNSAQNLSLYNQDSSPSQFRLPWVGNSSVNNTAIIKFNANGAVQQTLHLGQLGSSLVASITSMVCYGDALYIGGTELRSIRLSNFNRTGVSAPETLFTVQDDGDAFVLKYGAVLGEYRESAWIHMPNSTCTMRDMNVSSTGTVYTSVTCVGAGSLPVTVYAFEYIPLEGTETVISGDDLTLETELLSVRFVGGEFAGYASYASSSSNSILYTSNARSATGLFYPENNAVFTSYEIVMPSALVTVLQSFFAEEDLYTWVFDRNTNRVAWIYAGSLYTKAIDYQNRLYVALDRSINHQNQLIAEGTPVWNFGGNTPGAAAYTIPKNENYTVLVVRYDADGVSRSYLGMRGISMYISDFQMQPSGGMLFSLNIIPAVTVPTRIYIRRFDGIIGSSSILLNAECNYLFVALDPLGNLVSSTCLYASTAPASTLNYGMYFSQTYQNPILASSVRGSTEVDISVLKGTPCVINMPFNINYKYFTF